MLPYIGLKTRHNGLCNTNPGCHLSLGKSGSSPGFQNLVKKFEVLSECIILRRTSARESARSLNALRVFRIFHLFHALSRELKFFPWGLLRLLDELVQHHNFSSDQCTVENSRYTVRRLEPEFEKATTHCTGMRHSEVGP